MIVWKDPKDEAPWEAQGHPIIKLALSVISSLCEMFWGVDIVITSAIRPPKPNRFSFHPKGQALDLRTHGVDRHVLNTWIAILGLFNLVMNLSRAIQGKDWGRFDHQHEDIGGANEHFHFEYDTGDPA
jgi:hypothetical protein